MGIWVTFTINIVVCLVGILLYFNLQNKGLAKHFSLFLLATGISAGIAAFGHLELIDLSWQKGLLLISRILSLAAVAYFMAGTFAYNSFYHKPVFKSVVIASFITFCIWLALINKFYPVIVYGVIGLVGFGLTTFIPSMKSDLKVSQPIVIGIILDIFSAAVFALTLDSTIFTANDISHLILVGSMITMFTGFRHIQNEIKLST